MIVFVNYHKLYFLAAVRDQTTTWGKAFIEYFIVLFLSYLQGRLNELMSQIRMQNHFGAVRSEERYSVDADLLREIKQVRVNEFTQCILFLHVCAWCFLVWLQTSECIALAPQTLVSHPNLAQILP